MTTLIRFSPRKGASVDPALDLTIAGEAITVGRAQDNDVRLVDARVRFHHAVITLNDVGVTITAVDGQTITVGHGDATSATLRSPADTVKIGPYSVSLASPIPDRANTVLIFEAGESGDLNEAVLSRKYFDIFSYELPNIRLISTLFTFAIFVLFFTIPMAFAPGRLVLPTINPVEAPEGTIVSGTGAPKLGKIEKIAKLTPGFKIMTLWNVGSMSNGHSSFGTQCQSCHEDPFVSVRSEACMACHDEIGQHADPHISPVSDLNNQQCEDCHHEHKGTKQAIQRDQGSCITCHRDLKQKAPKTELLNVTDFGKNHPEFAPIFVDDPILKTTVRHRHGEPNPPEDHSNLKFPHMKHLNPLGVKSPNGPPEILDCSSCHIPENGGANLRPVLFEANCQRCHQLQFEPKHPEWHLPHAQPKEVANRILGFYSQAALNGEVFDKDKDVLFARPGKPIEAAGLPAANVRAQTSAALSSSIARSTCGQCHVTDAPKEGADPLDWTVRTVWVPVNYMKKAQFTHAKHVTMGCESCHDSRKSNGGSEAVLPGIETCRNCHAGEAGAPQRIATTCVSCHGFHRDGVIPMTPAKQKSAAIASPTQTAGKGSDITPQPEQPVHD